MAMAVFIIGMLSLLAVLTGSLNTTSDNRSRVVAANIAASDIDQARNSLSYSQLVTTSYTATVDHRNYQVFRSVAVTLSSGSNNVCIGGGSRQQLYKRVSTRVEFPFKESVQPVRSDTLVYAPIYDPTSNNGAAGLSVIDRNGQPVEGASVTVGGVTVVTNEAGCAFVDNLVPGSYTATASDPSFVDPTGNATPSTPVGVTAGQITNQTFQLDRAATAIVTPRLSGGSGTYVLPTSLTARLLAPNRSGASPKGPAAQSVATANSALSFTPIYPSKTGYEAFLGSCSTGFNVSSEPGASSSVDLPMTPVDITVTSTSLNVPILQAKTIRADWAGSGCSSPETLSFATTLSTTGTLVPLSTTGTAKIALPPGVWKLYLTSSTGFVSITVPPSTGVAMTASWNAS